MTLRPETSSSGVGSISSINKHHRARRPVLDLALHPLRFRKMASVWDGNIRLLGADYLARSPGARPSLGWHNRRHQARLTSIAVGDRSFGATAGDAHQCRTGRPPDHRHPRVPPLAAGNPTARRVDRPHRPGGMSAHVAVTGRGGKAWFFNTRITHAQSPNDSDR
jgi:hypothetical protein